ncbi:glycosyl transferase family 2 [Seonamhaeicola sp. S2-3]|uniref:glycosyltransferase family 2 protein n=1 Tax=Seonamhaeicola sp. S2-3 TaxID=1936081 RepID=UPI000972C77A|nr:glycosyltransferase family 2 protein [Seonamhaeicola sp. S2-3]APY11956.1 glycosyl transferase family 2 [Seonamhaeicola sp. S2-3]
MKDISAIIINYNSSTYTINCVKSIIEQTSKSLSFEIIIVDNASENEDFESLKNALEALKHPHIKLVKSRYNTGFGGGNMYGIQFANGKHYAFINNDTILQNDCLTLMFQFLENNEKAAICCPQQYDEKGEVKKSFDHFLSLKRELFGRKILEKINPKKYPKRQKIYTQPLRVQSVPGSFFVVKAQEFHEVGGFDTNIFLYYEETDLCYRIATNTKNGYSYLVPEGKYTHFKGKSTNENLEIKKELKISLLYVLQKNSGYVPYLILRWWLTIKSFFKMLIKPKKIVLFKLFLKGAPLSDSLKLKQTITN